MYKYFPLIIILGVALFGCKQDNTKTDLGYFSAPHLVDSLKEKKAIVTVSKTVVIDGKSETKTITDSLIKFIKFLEEFEINKPAYKGGFNIERNALLCDSSGCKMIHYPTTEYTLKKGVKMPVKKILIEKPNLIANDADVFTYSFRYEQSSLLSDIAKDATLQLSSKQGFLNCELTTIEHIKTGKTNSTKIIIQKVR